MQQSVTRIILRLGRVLARMVEFSKGPSGGERRIVLRVGFS